MSLKIQQINLSVYVTLERSRVLRFVKKTPFAPEEAAYISSEASSIYCAFICTVYILQPMIRTTPGNRHNTYNDTYF